MNNKTNLLEEYVSFVDTTKKRNRKLWKCTNTKCIYIDYSYFI